MEFHELFIADYDVYLRLVDARRMGAMKEPIYFLYRSPSRNVADTSMNEGPDLHQCRPISFVEDTKEAR